MKFLFLTTIILIIQLAFAGEIKENTELQIQEILGPHAVLTFSKISIIPKIKEEIEKKALQRFFRDEIYIWKVSQSDSIIGYAILDNVLGKSLPITFLALYDTLGTVIAVRVIKYREAYGGAISNHNWLKQFKNASITNYDSHNIDSITGATISVNAITKGVKKLTLLFPFIQKEIN